jgi:leucyl aminopeptidase
MKRSISVKTGALHAAPEEAVVVFRYQDGAPPRAFGAIARALGGSFESALTGAGFEGKTGQAVLVHTGGRVRAQVVVAAGLGSREGADPERVRQAAARAAQRARDAGCERVAFDLEVEGDPAETARACAEGALMGLYRFTRYKTENGDQRREVKALTLYADAADAAAARFGARQGMIVAEAVNQVRDLGNLPANVATPTYVADHARRLAREYGLACEVIDRKGMERLGMGALLGVARGSVEPPKLIILRYRGRGTTAANGSRGGDRPIALVGKTITFDSGGISLKPAENMEQMKSDMLGGAGVLSVLEAAARLQLPVSVVGLLPATENMPSGTAIKPGDVVTALSGTTIEVVNTDAEGRLVLADALAYAVKRFQPRLALDIATLTGACSIALGQHAIGLLGTDDALVGRLKRAADECGERVWQLPLWEDYYEQIKSDVADLKNTGGRPAGTITAAAFLSKFIGDTPWAHLDIAGTMWSSDTRHYVTKGATGAGVRLLIQFLADEGATPPKRTLQRRSRVRVARAVRR